MEIALRIRLASISVALFGTLASSAWLGCSSSDVVAASGAASGGSSSSIGGASNAAGAPSANTGAAGGGSAGASNGEAGNTASASGGSAASGAPSVGGAGGNASGGAALGGAAGARAAGGAGAGGSSGGAAGAPPANCNLSTPVSFQKDIQGFLAKSCGKTVDGGCHVTDSTKTSLGYDHAYDWITAFAHTGSCGKVAPYAKRFEVVLALLAGAKPASCPNARQMPPPGSKADPLTACQVAALQAWLAEPMVSQQHVPENDDTQSLYPAGPYLMPPFN